MPTIGTQLNVMIDPDKRDRFKNKVRGEGRTINDVINELIDAYLTNTNLPNQANLTKQNSQVDLGKAIADSPIIGEVLERLKKLEDEIISSKIHDNPPMPLNTLENEDNKTSVLNNSETHPSQDKLETTSNEIQDKTIIPEDKPVIEAISEESPEPETKENPESPPDTGIEGDDVELAKKSKGQKFKLSEVELKKAIADKDLDRLLALPLTEKFGKRELIKNLIPQAMWIKDRFVELEKKHPPKRRINGQKQSFNYSHLKTDQADEIIREFCQR
ncbi:hypothetical protein VB715_19590 [Crocosphaera sp. UHCC 0190]|uniref:hypothetical protein n=1 Tax=Crocosphaera sp. UHCC 0190 TaxID=3110246 RepID=UPI002B203C86|nr:hypothetical protein [Crocosphaera sp. UHCC 0190]MEA5511980.1 hypothetical protein [Crocosphaera sp. UHCC 0190]